jgi:hypothetical protein
MKDSTRCPNKYLTRTSLKKMINETGEQIIHHVIKSQHFFELIRSISFSFTN